MTAARTELPEATVLAALDPSDRDGTPTYVIRKRIAQGRRHGAPTVAVVRKALDRLERLGRVRRTDATRANQVQWAPGRRIHDPLFVAQLAQYPVITGHLKD